MFLQIRAAAHASAKAGSGDFRRNSKILHIDCDYEEKGGGEARGGRRGGDEVPKKKKKNVCL